MLFTIICDLTALGGKEQNKNSLTILITGCYIFLQKSKMSKIHKYKLIEKKHITSEVT